EQYRRWLEMTVASVANTPEEHNYLFILAWNEWAEGNHLEPDARYGRAFLEATRSVMSAPIASQGALPFPGSSRGSVGHGGNERAAEHAAVPPYDRMLINVAGLVERFRSDPQRRIVNLCAGSSAERISHLHDQFSFHALAGNRESVQRMKLAGIEANQCDITDSEALHGALEGLGDV